MTLSASLYDNYLAALLRGDRMVCAHVVRGLLADGVPIRSIYKDLFCAALYQVGDLWESNRISVATEHLATALTERVMGEVVAPFLFGHDPAGRSLVVSCAANEFHQIGGRMVADIAEMNGWDTCFLGANTPLDALLALLKEKQPDVLAMSLALAENLPTLWSTIEVVRAHHPDMPVWLGGQAFRRGWQDAVRKIPHVKLIHSLDEFEAELNREAAARATR